MPENDVQRFSLSALYPADALTIMSGEPVIGGLHGAARHFFCGWCMSWLFTRPEGMDDLVNIRSVMFDDAPAFRPYVETFTSESMPFVISARSAASNGFRRRKSFRSFWRPMRGGPADPARPQNARSSKAISGMQGA